jgi:tetratricopeptide (TPR) repeat protein
LRENNASHLSEAEAAVRDALNQWNAEANPLFWAIAHMNLGNILQEAGGREKGTQKLELAITSYENAAKYLTRITSPRTWALIQNNLANSLGLLGKKDPSTTGTTRLKESVRRLYDALQIRTRISNPTDWAQTQRNLGIVLTYLGEREEGTKRFEEAIQAHRSALEIIFRQHMPLDWASIQLNLGATLRIIGQRKRDQALYCEALKCYQKAWYTFTELKANQLSIAAQRRVVATMEHLERDFSKQALRHCLSQAPQ